MFVFFVKDEDHKRRKLGEDEKGNNELAMIASSQIKSEEVAGKYQDIKLGCVNDKMLG